jgi:alanine dehydrogenase
MSISPLRFGIVRERKNPPDRRVVLSPTALVQLKEQYPSAQFVVERSENRVYKDEEYQSLGIELTDSLADCDVLIGVKEVPIQNLLPNKSYFFFSHTIKKQPYNRELLRKIVENNITLYDHETIVDAQERRLIGFGKYAGIVGTYNAFRAFGVKFELFKLPKAETLSDQAMLISYLKRQVLPPLKIVVTGTGKVGSGCIEMLDAMKIKRVSVADFLSKKYTQAVYVQIDVLDYNKRKHGSVITNFDFYQNPDNYESDFARFANVADIAIFGHFYGNGAPQILSREMLQSQDCKIKVVADVSCDVNGPVACTLRSSTIAEPFYGYLPSEGTEVDVFHPAAIVVMAVDNLPCELPKDASDGFGEQFIQHVFPALMNGDLDGILNRAKITDRGSLTDRFKYLQDYID